MSTKHTLDDFMPDARDLFDRIRDKGKEEAVIHLAHAIGNAYFDGCLAALNNSITARRMTEDLNDATERPPAAGAVDPSVTDPGTPTTRDHIHDVRPGVDRVCDGGVRGCVDVHATVTNREPR